MDWVVIYEAGSLLEGQLVQGRLDSEGIPARLRYEALHTVLAPVSTRVEVLVPAEWAEAAAWVLASGKTPNAPEGEA